MGMVAERAVEEVGGARERSWRRAVAGVGLVGVALVYLLADQVVTVWGPRVVPGLWLPWMRHWNWVGKELSIGLSGVMLAGWPWLRRNVGLRWRQAPGSWRWSLACFGACVAYGCSGGLAARPVPFDSETLWFEALMPTLSEELAVRGIALAILERAFGADPVGGRLRFGWAAVIVSVLFGLGHGVSLGDGGVQVDVGPILHTAATGAVMALARVRSGSLVWPMLCHSAINLGIFGIAMARY